MKHKCALWLGIVMFFLISVTILQPEVRAAEYNNGEENDQSTIHNGLEGYYDCSGDQNAYGAVVARLQNQSIQKTENTRQTDFYIVVLCRTEGTEPDFSEWNANYVVKGPSNCFTLYFQDEENAQRAVQELSMREGIRYVEFDADVTASEIEDYSFYSWGAQEMNFGPYCAYASRWGSGTATVAIIDSGTCLHPMLSGRIMESGFDYVDVDEDSTNDLYGHGTNVAGIVADCTAGEPVYLYPIRVLNENGGGSISNVLNAVREATVKGVEVINLSLESSKLSEALDDAIIDAVNSGITVVVSAGNKSMDTSGISPAHLENAGVIIVGSVENDGTISSYSNFGASVDLYTYGTGIMCCSVNGGYVYATGTSMAAPHISGLAAMLQLIHNGISPAETEMRILCAVNYTAEKRILDLLNIIPSRLGIQLTQLEMELNEIIQLPSEAIPVTSLENIVYTSSDETVLRINDAKLIPIRSGTATVTTECFGFETSCFYVTIVNADREMIMIPESLLSVEDEAFRGNENIRYIVLAEGIECLGNNVFDECDNLKRIILPDSLISIGNNNFSDAVIFCNLGSKADQFVQENHLNHIIKY